MVYEMALVKTEYHMMYMVRVKIEHRDICMVRFKTGTWYGSISSTMFSMIRVKTASVSPRDLHACRFIRPHQKIAEYDATGQDQFITPH